MNEDYITAVIDSDDIFQDFNLNAFDRIGLATESLDFTIYVVYEIETGNIEVIGILSDNLSYCKKLTPNAGALTNINLLQEVCYG